MRTATRVEARRVALAYRSNGKRNESLSFETQKGKCHLIEVDDLVMQPFSFGGARVFKTPDPAQRGQPGEAATLIVSWAYVATQY
jgi:hypothetical protein